MRALLADWLADTLAEPVGEEMKRRLASRLHLLSVREVMNARDGEHSDGGGLTRRCNGDNAAWVFRYTRCHWEASTTQSTSQTKLVTSKNRRTVPPFYFSWGWVARKGGHGLRW